MTEKRSMDRRIPVHQLRLGFATNSSSCHSLILIPGGADDYDIRGGEFGWQSFTASSKEAKNLYLAVQLRDNLESLSGKEISQTVAEAWCGLKFGEPDEYGYLEEYVDHASRWALPRGWDDRGIDKEFFDDLRDFLMRDDVVVLGGNDNDGADMHRLYNDSAFQLPLREGYHLVARKDEGYWTLFHRGTGWKVRLSLTTGQSVEPKSARAPELVDIKITDFCTRGCKYCYQASNPRGEHADHRFVESLAYTLGKLKVFEAAIGGGEPTAHPHFISILGAFRRNGVIPNFTTKELSWLHDSTRRDRIFKHIGAFAYSVEDEDELWKLAALRDTYGLPSPKVAAQYVMGTQHISTFQKLLKASADTSIPLTLLDFKTDGRGGSFRPRDYSEWVRVLGDCAREHHLRVGIDTPLAARYATDLVHLGVPRWCYEVKEGAFSMYIDAVAKKTAPASYGHQDMLALQTGSHGGFSHGEEQLLEHFQRHAEASK